MLDSYIETIKAFFLSTLWAANLASLPPARAGAVRYLRIFVMMIRELANGQLNVRAASLVYTTLLSMIPVLAVSFAVLKGFDVHHKLGPVLLNLLEPLGEQGAEFSWQIIDFVDNVKVANLGSFGLAFLILTVISLLVQIEKAFNFTWRVRKPRSFMGRFSGYLTVVMVGPVLVFTALGITASVMGSQVARDLIAIEPFGFLFAIATKLVPFGLIIAAFTFVYTFIPNTKVKVRSAAFGACTAGFFWSAAGWIFATMVVTSARHEAIYSSFAIVILFMMWLYIAWLILLVGASVAFYNQHPENLGLLNDELQLSSETRERLGLNVCLLIAQHHLLALAPWSCVGLARRLRAPLEPLSQLLKGLERHGVLIAAKHEPEVYLPARDFDGISLGQLYATIRKLDEGGHASSTAQVRSEPGVDALLKRLSFVLDETLQGKTLRSWVQEDDQQGRETVNEDSASAPVPISSVKREGNVS